MRPAGGDEQSSQAPSFAVSSRPAGAFLVDRNVGRLVTWLRAFGFDTEFADEGDDGQLVQRALGEGRTLVTKDRRLLQRRVFVKGQLRAVAITQDDLVGQLREFLVAVPVDIDGLWGSSASAHPTSAGVATVPPEPSSSTVHPEPVEGHPQTVAAAPFTRCVRCNLALKVVEKSEVAGEVPLYVHQHHDAFSRCSGCRRVYWQGTHWKHMTALLREAVPHG